MRSSDWSSDVCSSDLLKATRSSLASAFTKSCASLSLLKGPTSRRLVKRSGVVQALLSDRSLGAFCFSRLNSRGNAALSAQNGRASCRDRVCHTIEIQEIAVSIKKKKETEKVA